MPTAVNMDKRLIKVDVVKEDYERRSVMLGMFVEDRIYSLERIPSFKPEPMMTSVADNLKCIEFALQPQEIGIATQVHDNNGWLMVAKMLNDVPTYGKQYSKNIPGTELIIDSAKNLLTKEDKINFIYQRVKQNMIWDEDQTFYPGNISDAWKARTGNSAEINLILLNLLRKCNIPCSPLLVSTRENGLIDEKFVSLSQFNGLDVLIKDGSNHYVLDATNKYQSFKTPPENVLNRQAFNPDPSNVSWLYISDVRPLLKSSITVSATLSEDGKITGNALMTYYDHSRTQRLIEKYSVNSKDIVDKKEFLQKDFTELKIDSLKLINEEDELLPLKEKFTFTYEPSASGDFLFLDPMFLSSFRKNPFTDSLRHSSLDFKCRQYVKTTVNLALPANYKVEHMPQDVRLRMGDSSILFQRNNVEEPDQLYFINTMEILYPSFDKEEYPAIRDFFSRMYTMITEQIILKKK